MDFDEGEKLSMGEGVKLSADRAKLKIIKCTEQEIKSHVMHLEAIEKASGQCMWNKE